MRYLILILLYGCGTAPNAKQDTKEVSDTYIINEAMPEPTEEPEPEEDTVEVEEVAPEENEEPAHEYNGPLTDNMWFDPVTGNLWLIGADVKEYAGPDPCGEGYWFMPTIAELKEAGLRGLSTVAENLGASPVGFVNDGYKACSVRSCKGHKTTTIYCMKGAELNEYDRPYIYGYYRELCSTKDLKETEPYCQEIE